MNYYERHLGDYARDTGHLSMLEHGAYSLLMDRYYATEAGIPADQAHRAARARSREERAAVDAVLDEFFSLTDGVWHHRRCDEEIAKFQDGAGDREAKRENAKERQRRARERRRELFDQLRTHGLVPDWNTATTELQRMLSRATSQHVTPPVTRDDTATQTPDPDTIQEIGKTEPSAVGLPAPSAAGRACLLMRQAGCAHSNPSHPELLAALSEGITAEALADTVREGVSTGKRNPFTWAIATARSRHADGAKPIGASHGNSTSSRKLSAVEQVEQAIRGRRGGSAEADTLVVASG